MATSQTFTRVSTKELNRLCFAYILDCIDSSGYDIECNTDAEKLQFVANCFKDEYCYENNLKQYGSYQNTFTNWLMGLPSSFNIDFENYRIIEIAKEWGSIPVDADDRQEDKILDNWFNFIAAKFAILCKQNKVKAW